MAYHHTQPVNFNDSESDLRPGGDLSRGPSRKTPAPSTAFSQPGVSRPVSGITAEDPFSERDEYGRTYAQTVAQQYLHEAGDGQGSMDDVGYEHHQHRHPGEYDDDVTTQSVYPYGSGRSEDAMTYIDENFNSYSNRRGPPPQLNGDSKSELVHDPQHRSFEDLGARNGEATQNVVLTAPRRVLRSIWATSARTALGGPGHAQITLLWAFRPERSKVPIGPTDRS